MAYYKRKKMAYYKRKINGLLWEKNKWLTIRDDHFGTQISRAVSVVNYSQSTKDFSSNKGSEIYSSN